ncbi:MAG: hypothetical protein WBW88_08005, partial [Rhodothermales bacterium]
VKAADLMDTFVIFGATVDVDDLLQEGHGLIVVGVDPGDDLTLGVGERLRRGNRNGEEAANGGEEDA